jgi:hypothetical protein
MTPSQLAQRVEQVLKQHDYVEIGEEELCDIFRQKERATPLGDAIMNFCGLPNEAETLNRFLAANNLVMVKNHKRMTWFIRKKAIWETKL